MTIALNTPNNANRRYERMRRYDTIHIFGAAVTPYYYYYLYNIYDEDMNILGIRNYVVQWSFLKFVPSPYVRMFSRVPQSEEQELDHE